MHNQLEATTIYVTHDQVEAMTLADKIVVLKEGEVMQVGSPLQLFNAPENEFVASFLGSPKMNFFDGSIISVTAKSDKADFTSEEFDVKGVRLVSTYKNSGDIARLGIRPQHLRLDAKGSLTGRITLVERLGTETIAELVTPKGTQFRFASPDTPDVDVGQTVSFTFDAKDVHLF